MDTDTKARRDWMSLLAKAPEAELSRLWAEYGDQTGFEWLRKPEVGGAMVRGRMGATGQPFNLGEMTVTRCSVRLNDGTVGHGYVQGRNRSMAETAARIDALMQGDAGPSVRTAILDPLEATVMSAKRKRAAKAAATKVEFFTMVRGEDK
ncbi:MAG: phosphonate C-P lyase system protein PhnG [Pseudomonadota bacterium]